MAEGERMSKKMNGKVAKAENVKRAIPEPKTATVNGKAKFENGKLQKPTATEQLMEMQAKKAELKEREPKTLAEAQGLIEKLRAQLKSNRAPKLEDLPDEENCPIQYINFCQVQKYREELKYILAELSKIPNIEVRNNAYCDCYRIHGTLVGEVFCLKRQWSARVVPNRVRRWDTADEYLEALKARIAGIPKVEQKEPVVKAIKAKKSESVEDIKGRIEKLSAGHNAIHIKKVTPEIEALVKAQKYKLIDSEEGGANLLVR
jgi:DNA-directed RNA polymerase subunit H (RpoH/RPB5)